MAGSPTRPPSPPPRSLARYRSLPQLFLFGAEHDLYWNHTVHSAVKAVSPVDKFPAAESRLHGFVGGRFTIIFFESHSTIASYQANVPAYADRFPEWSTHGSGMAQVNTWNALAQAGYGVNLQHYTNLTQEAVKKQYGLPSDWVAHAEMVVGSPEGQPKEKTFIPDEDRFVVKGL